MKSLAKKTTTRDSQWIMAQVLLALLPTLFCLFYLAGLAFLSNLIYTSASALISEAAFLYLQKKSPRTAFDGSALISAWLLAISLPLGSSALICFSASIFAVIFAKQLYGGVGFNLFNPAMAGFAFVFISFPEAFNSWPHLAGTDAISGATALELLKQNQGLTLDQLNLPHQYLLPAAISLGGIYLLIRRIFSWHSPVAFLAGITLCSALFYQHGGSLSGGSPWFNVLSGGTLLATFFIITDPVTSAASPKGKLLYAFLAGCLVYCLRHFSHFTDAIAFAILLANFCVPLIDKVEVLCAKT